MLKPRPTRDPADTLAALLESDPWATPMGLASLAVSRAQQAVRDLTLAPEAKKKLLPEAIAQLARGRRFVFDARGLVEAQLDRALEQGSIVDARVELARRHLSRQVGGPVAWACVLWGARR